MEPLTIKRCRCGADPKLDAEGGMVDIVKCSNCGAEGPPFFDGAEWAIEEWNKGKREKEGRWTESFDWVI